MQNICYMPFHLRDRTAYSICFLNYSVKVLIDEPIHMFVYNKAESNLVSSCPFVTLVSVLKLILICFNYGSLVA